MKVDDTPRTRTKNLDVLKEWEMVEKKNEANFVVIGMLPPILWLFRSAKIL